VTDCRTYDEYLYVSLRELVEKSNLADKIVVGKARHGGELSFPLTEYVLIRGLRYSLSAL